MMKRLLLASLLFFPLALAAYISPGHPTGYVNDFAGMLKPETITALNQTLSDFTSTTGNEISVVTIPTHGTDETIETYATKLFQEWGIGKAKEDNGLLLLIARDDREMRIEVGYGLEPIITDIESAHIISDVLTPAFKAGNYDNGVRAAMARITDDIGKGGPPAASSHSTPISSGFISPILVFLMFLGSILSRSKSWWAGGVIGGIIGVIFFSGIIILILIVVGLIFDYLVSKNYQKHRDNNTRPPWFIGGGGFGGGRGGGGFGGFGGGMSGGGGASGRW